ncbi:MAG: helix-turn-helix transcriptional regulator [Bacteroidota bacterium]
MAQKQDEIFLMNSFPDFTAPGFDINRYNRRFVENNVIINARSSDIHYDEHWGPLSMKFAFGGSEQYIIKNKKLSVDDNRFLIVNEGSYYSSSIHSDRAVESFTINFSRAFVRSALSSYSFSGDVHRESLRDPELRFEEHLYPHHAQLRRSILSLRRLSLSPIPSKQRILEVFHESLDLLFSLHGQVGRKIANMSPVRESTKKELYRRLCASRDFMYSCYDLPLTLEKVSGIACLAPAYFLRQFKKNFGMTPHQFLTERRLQKASELIRTNTISVTRACVDVGFEDVSSFSKLFKKRFGISPSQAESRRF